MGNGREEGMGEKLVFLEGFLVGYLLCGFLVGGLERVME